MFSLFGTPPKSCGHRCYGCRTSCCNCIARTKPGSMVTACGFCTALPPSIRIVNANMRQAEDVPVPVMVPSFMSYDADSPAVPILNLNHFPPQVGEDSIINSADAQGLVSVIVAPIPPPLPPFSGRAASHPVLVQDISVNLSPCVISHTDSLSITAFEAKKEAMEGNVTTGGDIDGRYPLCVICMNESADLAIIPCGHLCMCQVCSKNALESCKRRCPLCRTLAKSLLKIFLPN